jgi:hypothetical protein
MVVKLFILGLPGCGKSTAAHMIEKYVPKYYKGRSVAHKSDYGILKKMCYEEHDDRLRPIGDGAFDVVEPSAFNSALKRLKNEVQEAEQESPDSNQLILIEFSRNDYSFALEEFFPELLSEASFLFIKALVSECRLRIDYRVKKENRTEDDHEVSEFIFIEYYNEDQQDYRESVGRMLIQTYNVPPPCIQIIEDSELTEDDFKKTVAEAIDTILLAHEILPSSEDALSTESEPETALAH